MWNLRIFNFLDLWKYQIKTLWSVNFSISFHTWTLKLLLRFFEMRCFYFLICVKRTQDPPPPLSEIVQLSFRYISFHEVSHWNKPIFAIILRTTKIYPLRLKIVGQESKWIKRAWKYTIGKNLTCNTPFQEGSSPQ